MKEINKYPNLLAYVAFPGLNTIEEFTDMYHKDIGSKPEECLYAIYDKTAPGGETDDNYAGTVAYTGGNKSHASTDVGIILWPAFQRTHVATNAIGLLLLHALDPPSAGGLGLRRVVWTAHSENAASRNTALRLGFEFEGITRWHKIFADREIGSSADALAKRNGTEKEIIGRHTATYSIVWDEWDEKRPKLVALMKRPPPSAIT